MLCLREIATKKYSRKTFEKKNEKKKTPRKIENAQQYCLYQYLGFTVFFLI